MNLFVNILLRIPENKLNFNETSYRYVENKSYFYNVKPFYTFENLILVNFESRFVNFKLRKLSF